MHRRFRNRAGRTACRWRRGAQRPADADCRPISSACRGAPARLPRPRRSARPFWPASRSACGAGQEEVAALHPQRFVVPVYRQWDRLLLAAGLTAYGWLAGARSLGPSRLLSVDDTLAALPGVQAAGLVGGIAYMDARFDDARLAIALMRTVFDLGGLTINHLPVTGLRHTRGRVSGIGARDAETGEAFEIAAQVVINAAGVWGDEVRQLDDPAAPAQLAPSQGAHLVHRPAISCPAATALLIPKTQRRPGALRDPVAGQGCFLAPPTRPAPRNAPWNRARWQREIDFILDTAGRYLARRRRAAPTCAAPSPGCVHCSAQASGGSHFGPVPGARRSRCPASWPGVGGRRKMDHLPAHGSRHHRPRRTCRRGPARPGLHRRPRWRCTPAPPQPSNDVFGTDRAIIDRLPGAGQRIHPAFTLSEAEVRHGSPLRAGAERWKTCSPGAIGRCSSTPRRPSKPPPSWPPSWPTSWASMTSRPVNRRKPSSGWPRASSPRVDVGHVNQGAKVESILTSSV
jgi:hypothetical protein